MFRQLTPGEWRALVDGLAARGVTPQQFAEAQEKARSISEALARAYSEEVGHPVTPVQFVADVLGVEGAGRLLACALRETTGRPDLYRDI
ncbi:hypothetical protein ACH4ZX_12375 [Streptomyces sp. NPDC020490]|uniref:hypothetical protein n=1 Tax=Streptomyces sp. NPDC020490 TaxID=3365078 RepID=UPI0037962B2F